MAASGAEIAARIGSELFDELDAPVTARRLPVRSDSVRPRARARVAPGQPRHRARGAPDAGARPMNCRSGIT